MLEWLPLLMFAGVCVALLLGYPVAFTLAGVALLFASGGIISGYFDPALLKAMPERVYGTMVNETLIAVPLFILMGIMLERTGIAERLLDTMARLFGRLSGGLGLSVVVVGMLLAASTGIVGATVVAMGLMSLPSMLKRGYDPSFAAGTICATGTLGQIIPPSIALVLLGDVLSSAYQQAQTRLGIFNPETVSVGDLFVGALLPGCLLVVLYLTYVWLRSYLYPADAPAAKEINKVLYSEVLFSLLPPLGLIVLVLGSIISGVATPTEAAGVGAMGATCLAMVTRSLTLEIFRNVLAKTLEMTSMVFLILIGASFFSLVFRGYGGEELVHGLFENLPGGTFGAMLTVMCVVFLLGFILDFIEITFVVVPIVGPVLLAMGIDPVWLGIMIAVNLQTSFLTPPFGFALFYLRSVAPESVKTVEIYKGVLPYIGIQLLVLLLLALFPAIATWLPSLL
ncbi:MAG: TRAP transporter large permease subunit [Proteobacteria bacterium]|jgi:tripartite ATP-independent transporter DctM subunit|nr:TRAP transporter large permease subunit [Pseudomonadota bacterium]